LIAPAPTEAARTNAGLRLRQAITRDGIVPLIGVYDTFSATIAARHFQGLFLSGFGFAASFYGLPDIGFIAWSDIVAYVQRLRAVLPEHHIVVDIDDGYCDAEVAARVTRMLEALGASGVVLEDQLRPRRCGHLDGKQIMGLNAYLDKLQRVLDSRQDLLVVARTDAGDEREAARRVSAFAEAGADAVLVEAVRSLDVLADLKRQVGVTLAFNQIAGGQSPPADLAELCAAGVGLVNYSTPCLFAAHSAIDRTLRELAARGGRLPGACDGAIELAECDALLRENLAGLGMPPLRSGPGRG
jgi:2-methylisocitrate lyase-like PEP mutase family enzyme